jgi:segregation and condensation protein A
VISAAPLAGTRAAPASSSSTARPLGYGSEVPADQTETATETPGTGFHVDLGDLFEGPFDLLLGLIAKHKLDVTEVALSKVTDEFIAHIKALGSEWDLGQATEFLVVAATLLDLKAARLLPSGEVEDEEDLALLETCSSRGCCSTAPTSRSPPSSPAGWPTRPVALPGP